MKSNQREVQQPELARADELHGDTYTHPRFGLISASRVSGGGHGATLHGSDF